MATGARILFQLLAGVALLLSAAFAVAYWGGFPLGSPLSGAGYLPPSWLAAIVVPSCVGCWLLRARRSAAIALLGYALLVLPAADFPAVIRRAHAAAPGRKLSVVALNVQYYSHGIENVVRGLKGTGADVALLSENVLDPAQAARVRLLFAPWHFRMGRSGETAIASRHPVISFKEVDLPTKQVSLSHENELGSSAGAPQRSFCHAVLDVGGQRVNVLSLRLIAGRPPSHGAFDAVKWGVYLVRAQAEEWAAFRAYVATLSGPVVFGGDLNAPPAAPVLGSLRRSFDDAALATGRWPEPTFRVHPFPYLRLDYLFASRDSQVLDAHRVNVELSDHFPVYAEIAVPP